uniref:Uncharacterized protein n=1 Tax=Panagrolaimus sp. JU765 TaxID=591449 RepID=A0AC34RSY3_9BILA
MDLHHGIIYAGYYLLPATVSCCTGLCKTWGMYWGSSFNYYVFETNISIMGFALSALISYRYHVLKGTNKLMEQKWFIPCLFLISIIYVIPVLVTQTIAIQGMTTDTIIDYINHTAPQYFKIVNTGLCSGFVRPYWAMVYFACTCLQTAGVSTLALYYSINSVLLLRSLRSSMTPTTYALQKQFVFSVFVQIIVPLSCFVSPILLILITAAFGYNNLHLSEIFVKTTLLHAPLNGLAVLLTIKPYREAVKQMISKIFPKINKKDNLIHVQPTISANNLSNQN